MTPGLLKRLAMWSLFRRFLDRDQEIAWGLPPRCSDGTRNHDLKGQAACPACGWRPLPREEPQR